MHYKSKDERGIKMKIKLKSFNITLLIVLLFISEIFQLKVTFLKYTDEIICVIGVIYLIFNIVMKKKENR